MTKENIKEVQEVIKKVAEKKSTYKLGDEVKAYGKNCKIVEVLAEGRYHCKNLESPFDSFVVLADEIGVEVQKSEHDPDLLWRKDDRFSL